MYIILLYIYVLFYIMKHYYIQGPLWAARAGPETPPAKGSPAHPRYLCVLHYIQDTLQAGPPHPRALGRRRFPPSSARLRALPFPARVYMEK